MSSTARISHRRTLVLVIIVACIVAAIVGILAALALAGSSQPAQASQLTVSANDLTSAGFTLVDTENAGDTFGQTRTTTWSDPSGVTFEVKEQTNRNTVSALPADPAKFTAGSIVSSQYGQTTCQVNGARSADVLADVLRTLGQQIASAGYDHPDTPAHLVANFSSIDTGDYSVAATCFPSTQG